MSDKLREAAKAALLALKCLDGLECAREEIENLEAALAEPEPTLGVMLANHDQQIKDLAAQLLELKQLDRNAEQPAALRKDAARYRWLRDDKRGRSLSVSSLEWTGSAELSDAAVDAAKGKR